MKRKKAYVILIFFLLASCEYYYTDNLFQGLWQVISIEDRNNDTTIYPEGEVYYAFQRHMIQLSHIAPNKPIGNEPTYYLSYFTHEEDSLHVGPFRTYPQENTYAELRELKRFGIYNLETTFKIEETKRRLILISDSAIVTLWQY